MHEVARFNQTFYPYACVLFFSGLRSAARHAVRGNRRARTRDDRLAVDVCGRLCRWCHRCGLVGLR
ncbi:hypothetical protein GDR29_01350 [Xanthomonas oryzae pv. oryzae]|nr:hypothetical protein GDR29_01350 [Xanthomonas oryzae pv. oryzae]